MAWNFTFLILSVLGVILGWIGVKPILWPRFQKWRQEIVRKRPGAVTFKVANCVLQSPPQEPYFPESMTFEPNKPYTLSGQQFEDLQRRSVGVEFEILSRK